MAENDLVRVEIGFHGGGAVTARVAAAEADALEERLRRREDAVCEVSTDEGVYLVVLAHVLYMKRSAREARVGFSSG